MKGNRIRGRGQDGAVAVEFALIFPILALLVVGIIQFGIMWSEYQVMQGAAREGARCAATQAAGFSSCVVTDRVDAALPGGYTRSGPVSVSVEGGGSACTGTSTIGKNVTVSWTQQFGTGVLNNLVPGFPDTITRDISGTFRCE
ncbi:MAG TPA: TadE/TadG family type IV pilus assembly protein [Actinomycetota bacterium]|nr:TadE/TadG family type IV pilus assembly protein [Actinomycetota bacterium]